MPDLRPREMTDSELFAEIERTPEETNYYDELMAEREERVMIRRSYRERALRARIGYHAAHSER